VLLHGRDAEVTRIDSLLDSAREGRSGTLVIRGDPGIGKSALLQYAKEQASGMAVLEARGLEAEADLAFSGLSDLFRPVLDLLETIPQPQSEALAGALGLGPPVAGDRYVVCVATLSLIAAAAEARPVLAVVDDIHWLDGASGEALRFAGHRLEAEPVALMMACRTSVGSPVEGSGFEELNLAGLDRSAASDLLEDRIRRPIAAHVIDRLVGVTGGNPLALCELAAGLSARQLVGEQAFEETPFSTADMERALVGRIERLNMQTRQGLLIVAAGSGITSTVGAAFELLGLPLACLEPAAEQGVTRVEEERIVFSHPLLRAAVYDPASVGERVRAHAALAEGLIVEVEREEAGARGQQSRSVTERRAWHLAAAARHPDESVAAVLESAAGSAAERGGYAASASALERAAMLSPSGTDRARRLVAAARGWQLGGSPERALGLLDGALSLVGDVRQSAEIQHLRAQVEMSQGAFAVAAEMLEKEAATIAALDEAQAALMLADAALAASTVGQIESALRLGRQAQALGRRSGGMAEVAADMIFGGLLVLSGETNEGRSLVLRHARLPEGQEPPPVVLQILPTVLIVLEEYERARSLLDWLVESARALSAPALLVPALMLYADLGYRTGDWLGAYANAAEGLRLARETNGNVIYGLTYLAQVEAGRGLENDCRAHIAELAALGSRFEVGAALTYGHAFLGRLALGLGLIEEAILELEAAAALTERHKAREPNWVQEAPDLIEAYVRAGRVADAAEALSALEEKATGTESIWARAAAARCRGLLADERSFEQRFEEALAWHERRVTPFERARTELCFGERLRRSGRAADAERHLRSALDAFDHIGAGPWTARTRAELGASGDKPQSSNDVSLRSLTPHEVQVALIVGRGATNKEASAALFISPKTVEAHLHHVYVKLGIRSRTELARVLARERMLD
jgi:DNA-binding CsgD family transcriptional regulator/tetratricopeptide (TPR) repeat protein